MRAKTDQEKDAITNALKELFTYHSPFGDQPGRYVEIREAGKLFAETVLLNTEKGADQSAALRKIREAVMTANAAIALEEPPAQPKAEPAAEPAPQPAQ